jgi:site-specific DNA-methyltransferase (adenine-specific)
MVPGPPEEGEVEATVVTCDVRCGKCEELLKEVPDGSVDAVVTDPPYHLTTIVRRFGKADAAPVIDTGSGVYARSAAGFMHQTWDGGDLALRPELWAELLRTAKPGAYVLAFGHVRTHHRMACAIEDAGWEIRDEPEWVYSQGFPKGIRALGGKHTGLKPAREPITMGRKPFEGTVQECVDAFGTGALNVQACRVPREGGSPSVRRRETSRRTGTSPGHPGVQGNTITNRVTFGVYSAEHEGEDAGNWPANLIHDGSDAVADVLGDAMDCFYCAKPCLSEREAGLDSLPAKVRNRVNPGGLENDPRWAPMLRKNHHATVKPINLMRHLVRMVCSPGGIVLDPFCGSGTTGCGALLEGCAFLGMDMDEEFCEISRLRCAFWLAHPEGPVPERKEAVGQLKLPL